MPHMIPLNVSVFIENFECRNASEKVTECASGDLAQMKVCVTLNPAGFSAENCWFSKESCQSAQLTWPMESDGDEFRI